MYLTYLWAIVLLEAFAPFAIADYPDLSISVQQSQQNTPVPAPTQEPAANGDAQTQVSWQPSDVFEVLIDRCSFVKPNAMALVALYQ